MPDPTDAEIVQWLRQQAMGDDRSAAMDRAAADLIERRRAERDEAREAYKIACARANLADECATKAVAKEIHERQRAEQAEAERDRLRGALEECRSVLRSWNDYVGGHLKLAYAISVATAALAQRGGAPEPSAASADPIPDAAIPGVVYSWVFGPWPNLDMAAPESKALRQLLAVNTGAYGCVHPVVEMTEADFLAFREALARLGIELCEVTRRPVDQPDADPVWRQYV